MAGKYDKVELIGSGTFGNAWLVLKADTGRKYVLKEVQVLGMSEKSRKQALTEVRALSRCKHMNVVRYKEAFVDQRALCIVMEFADGGDLHHNIQTRKGKPFDCELIIDWFIQICFALRSIHNLSIIHRDLKTQNIFLTSSGIIKLGDLGIARILKMNEDHANTAVGTPYYLSPEICKRKPYDYKTDMWAAGCVLYELCTFKHPFEGPCFSSLVLKITTGKYKSISKSCGPILEDLVAVLLKTDPEQRPSAEQVLCVPSLQPYIEAYVSKTQAIKEQQILASPCVSGPDGGDATPDEPTVSKPTQSPHSQPHSQPASAPPKEKESPVSKGPDARKRALSTPRSRQESTNKRRAQSAKSGAAGNTPLKIRELVANSPKLSLYKEVLRKRQPLASLGTPNSPQPVLALPKMSSPIANRTRKHSQEGKLEDNNTPGCFSPKRVSSPRVKVHRAYSERCHVRNRVQEIMKQAEDNKVNYHIYKSPDVVDKPIQGKERNRSAVPNPPSVTPEMKIETSQTGSNKCSPLSQELSLERQVQQCLLRTCCPKPDVLYTNMEILRHFLDDKLGSKQFYSVYNRLKEFGTEHVHLDSFCSNDKISTCFPVLIQLLQLEHFAK